MASHFDSRITTDLKSEITSGFKTEIEFQMLKKYMRNAWKKDDIFIQGWQVQTITNIWKGVWFGRNRQPKSDMMSGFKTGNRIPEEEEINVTLCMGFHWVKTKDLYAMANMCECFSIFLSKIIYLHVTWLKWYFYTWKCSLPEEYKPLCELTEFVSSTLRIVFYPQNILLWLK